MSNSVFPTFVGLSWPVKRTPIFNTKVVDAVSGRECRASFMAYPKYKIELQFNYLSLADYKSLGGFFKLRKGRFDSFLFDDKSDNFIAANSIGTGNGTNKIFQLVRAVGGFTEPVENVNYTIAPKIFLNAVEQSPANYAIGATGIVTFVTAPSAAVAVTWTGYYYYRCRFEQDTNEFAENMAEFYESKKLAMIGATGNKV